MSQYFKLGIRMFAKLMTGVNAEITAVLTLFPEINWRLSIFQF